MAIYFSRTGLVERVGVILPIEVGIVVNSALKLNGRWNQLKSLLNILIHCTK